MTVSNQFSFSQDHNDIREIIPYGATMDDTLPSFRSILGGSNDQEVAGLTPAALAKKISGINEFYHGLKAPYISAQHVIRRVMSEKRSLLHGLATRKQKNAARLEIEQLEDGLSWSVKKLNVLESERIALISKLS